MTASTEILYMHNGTPYEIQPCLEPELHFTPERFREEIRRAWKQLSVQSRWQRLACATGELSEQQLSYLSDLDGVNRVAWCAVLHHQDEYRGIGTSRYYRLEEEPDTAEFAVTVLDQFQGQSVGTALLEKLVDTAGENHIRRLRGFVMPGNRKMLALSQHFEPQVYNDNSVVRVEIDTGFADQ